MELTTIYIISDNEIYTWGKGARGRLGSGDEENKSKPMLVKFQEKSRVISISANRGTTVAVTKEGNIHLVKNILHRKHKELLRLTALYHYTKFYHIMYHNLVYLFKYPSLGLFH